MVRVLVAEDSPTVRMLITAMLSSDPQVTVVGEATNGKEAVAMTADLRPDVVTMDVNMPLLDGLDATKEIMARTPTPIVIVSAAAEEHDVSLSLSATRAGALLVLPTPRDPQKPDFPARRAEFVAMIKAMADVKVVRRRDVVTRVHTAVPPLPVPSGRRVDMVVIAASTGGPAALQRLLGDMPHAFPAPVAIVQHIAPGFTAGLCTWLNAGSNLRVRVAEDGEELAPHTVYLAPDDAHFGVRDGRVQLSHSPPIDGFRPSASHLFNTAAAAFGAGTAAVIMTGMGRDGVAGLRAVHAAGGHIVAQDEATSVVFGMPAEAVRAGVVDVVLQLDQIAGYLTYLVRGSVNGT